MLEIATRHVSVTAHRGNSVLAPENTMSAFRIALSQGADAVETDVRLTADGVPVLIHDPDLQRMAGAPAAIAALTLAELREFDISGESVPTLTELAELCRGQTRLALDLKVEGALPAVAASLAAAGYPQFQVTACAWTATQAADVQRHLPASHLVSIEALPLAHVGAAWFAARAAAGYRGLSVRLRVLTPVLVGLAHDAGLSVMTWTIKDPESARRALALGVDDVITDDPAALYASAGVSGAG